MRRILVVLAIVLATAGATALARADEDTDIDMMRSQTALNAGDIPQALEAIDAVIADQPDYAPAYLVRARIWMVARDFPKAVDDYSQAIADGFGQKPYVYTMRAGAWAAGGDYARAIADYEQALKLNPGYWPAIAGRGTALAESGDVPRALADLNRALAHDPGDIKEVLATQHVQVQSRKGPPQQGTNTLSITLHTAPLMAQTYTARGKLRFDQGAYQDALADLDEAVKRLPALAAAHFYRGLTLLTLGRCREGQDEFKAQGVRGAAVFQAALARHHEAIAKAGCAVQAL